MFEENQQTEANNLETTSRFQEASRLIVVDIDQKSKFRVLKARMFVDSDPNADQIDLEGVEFEEIEPYAFKKFSKVKYLYMNMTRVSRFDSKTFVGLTSLREFTMNETCLSEIAWDDDFRDFGELRRLDLCCNQLDRIDVGTFCNMRNLSRLQVAMNQISEISVYSFVELRNLKILDLSHNKLRKIKSSHFKGLENLEILDLEHNKIDEIHEDAFVELKKIKYLSIASNLLKTLNTKWLESLDGTLVGCVDLSRNPYGKKYASLYDLTKFPPDEYLEYRGTRHIDLMELITDEGDKLVTKWSEFWVQFRSELEF